MFPAQKSGFHAIGVNYWSRAGGPLMWRKWRPDVVAEELAQLKSLGMNTCRSFLYWPDFMPRPDRVEESMLARFDEFLDLCEKAELLTIPTFFVGHMSCENWDVPWREGRSFYTDPFMLERQSFYASVVARRSSKRQAILGWLLSNEMPQHEVAPDNASGRLWARTIISAVKAADPQHPVSIGDGAWSLQGRDIGLDVEELAESVDFFGPHTYELETDSLRHSQLPSFLVALAGSLGKPVLLEEFGCSSAWASDEHQADYFRTSYATALLAGGVGSLAWCFSDFDPLAHQRPYVHHPHELYFGVTRADGSVKPAGQEIKRFSRLVSRLDLGRYERPAPRACLVVPQSLRQDDPFWYGGPTRNEQAKTLLESYTLAKCAKLPVGFFREPAIEKGVPHDIDARREVTLPAHDLFIVPHTFSLSAPVWEALYAAAERGATVYASFFHFWMAYDFERLFGCRHRLRFGLADLPKGPVNVRMTRNFGCLLEGSELVLSPRAEGRANAFCPVDPTSARVLAVDGDGRPALLENKVGSGRIVLSTYPVERYLLGGLEAHAGDSSYLLYRALRDVAGIEPEFDVDHPNVELGILNSAGGPALWLVNHGWDEARVAIESKTPVTRYVDVETDEPVARELRLAGKALRVLTAECAK